MTVVVVAAVVNSFTSNVRCELKHHTVWCLKHWKPI